MTTTYSGPQEEFCMEFWRELISDQAVDITRLSGAKAQDPTSNGCFLGKVPLSAFHKTLVGENFLETYKRPPYAVIRIGKEALLVLVDVNIGEESDGASLDSTPKIISLEHSSFYEVATIGHSDYSLRLGRTWLRAKTGNRHTSVSRDHAELGIFVDSWMIQDIGSMNGTEIAVEKA